MEVRSEGTDFVWEAIHRLASGLDWQVDIGKRTAQLLERMGSIIERQQSEIDALRAAMEESK